MGIYNWETSYTHQKDTLQSLDLRLLVRFKDKRKRKKKGTGESNRKTIDKNPHSKARMKNAFAFSEPDIESTLQWVSQFYIRNNADHLEGKYCVKTKYQRLNENQDSHCPKPLVQEYSSQLHEMGLEVS